MVSFVLGAFLVVFASCAPQPANSGSEPNSALEALTEQSKRLVEQHAKFFVRASSGELWDRQLWLERERHRDLLRKSASSGQPRSDIQRALGVAATAPLDTTSLRGGLVRAVDGTGRFTFDGDFMNTPLLWHVSGRTRISEIEIQALSVTRHPMDNWERLPPDAREIYASVTPAELAQALKAGRAELSKFKFSKKVIRPAKKATPPARDTPEVADFVWTRTAIKIYWKDDPAPNGSTPAAGRPQETPASPDTTPP